MPFAQKTLTQRNDPVAKGFFEYLKTLPLSAATFRLYKSDLSHFTAWLIFKVRTFGSYADNLTEASPFIGRKLLKDYISFLSTNHAPESTVNRRLSTLRHFASFLLEEGVLNFDFMQGVENLKEKTKIKDNLLSEFGNHLKAEKVAESTLKNYLSDVKQFLSWLEKQKEYA